MTIALTIAATAAFYRGLLKVAATGPADGRRAALGRWLGADDRRSGGAGEER